MSSAPRPPGQADSRGGIALRFRIWFALAATSADQVIELQVLEPGMLAIQLE